MTAHIDSTALMINTKMYETWTSNMGALDTKANPIMLAEILGKW